MLAVTSQPLERGSERVASPFMASSGLRYPGPHSEQLAEKREDVRVYGATWTVLKTEHATVLQWYRWNREKLNNEPLSV